jgi:hypothetical protein
LEIQAHKSGNWNSNSDHDVQPITILIFLLVVLWFVDGSNLTLVNKKCFCCPIIFPKYINKQIKSKLLIQDTIKLLSQTNVSLYQCTNFLAKFKAYSDVADFLTHVPPSKGVRDFLKNDAIIIFFSVNSLFVFFSFLLASLKK